MERKECFLNIVSKFSENHAIAVKYTEYLEQLFDYICPEKIGEEYKEAIKNGDFALALNKLGVYFRNKPENPMPYLCAKGEYITKDADNYLKGKLRVVSVDWEFEGGNIDFLFNPTIINQPVNHEWLWQHNRHNQWINLARTYTATKDEKYAEFFNKQILKWISQTEIPKDWNGIGSAYRTIECGLRLMYSWPVAFDGFKNSPSLPDISLVLMIASMHRQSVHLKDHPTSKNWLMMESCGMYTFSSIFTEFSDSEKNRKIAADRMLCELENQILPDGMHNELSPDYQMVVFNCAFNFYSLAKNMGYTNELPENLSKLIKRTVDAAILLSTPALTQPRTNDCFTMYTSDFTQKAAEIFGHLPQYEFVNSKREKGAPPENKTPSAFLDYAGFVVMRSAWDADATYMCFDVGPMGEAHYHQDKLNINIYKGNQELIYDDGGGQYDDSPARIYAHSGYGHNTVLVDSLAQKRKMPRSVTEPIDAGFITNEKFDYAAATYDDTFGEKMISPATHKREVRFCKPDFFVVSDTLTSIDGNAHDYEVLFHLDTTKVKTISEYKNAVISDFGKDYEIAIIPLDEPDCVSLEVVSGIWEPPYIKGWYNGRNDKDLHKSTTISRKVSKSKDFRFNTLLIPVKSGSDIPQVTQNKDGTVTVFVKDNKHSFDVNTLNL